MPRGTRSPRFADTLNARYLDGERSLRLLLLRLFSHRPHDVIGAGIAGLAVAAIMINALLLQAGPHPAPIIAMRQRPPVAATERAVALPRPRPDTVAKVEAIPPAAPRAELIADMQKELASRGFYAGAIDGIYGPKMDAALRDFVQAAGLKWPGNPTEELLRLIKASTTRATPATQSTRHDPIAELIAPTKRVLAVQRALADYGYGQISPSGLIDDATKAAIEKFERDRRLPVTGEVSDRLVRELSAMTGRPLE